MEHLWSPWRMQYMQNGTPATDCIFCSAWQQNNKEKLVVTRTDHAVVMLNRYPYTSGHLMVAPKDHLGVMGALNAETLLDLVNLLSHAEQVLGKVYSPDGFNVGANIGSAAGAGVADHLHFHIVPRWSGDTNFMTAVGDARVLPETLDDTLKRIRSAW
ncbi:MAG: HIT domain-containing protein [Anaerolineaceae bacterium]|nr:HIT domain-containing protein [Anaerolineaceae bacterium]